MHFCIYLINGFEFNLELICPSEVFKNLNLPSEIMRMRDFFGPFCFYCSQVFYILGAFLIKQMNFDFRLG